MKIFLFTTTYYFNKKHNYRKYKWLQEFSEIVVEIPLHKTNEKAVFFYKSLQSLINRTPFSRNSTSLYHREIYQERKS